MDMISFSITNLTSNIFISLQTLPYLPFFPQTSYSHTVKTNNLGNFWHGGYFTFFWLVFWSLFHSHPPLLKLLGMQVVKCHWHSDSCGGSCIALEIFQTLWSSTNQNSHPKSIQGPIRNQYLLSTYYLEALLNGQPPAYNSLNTI